MSQEEQDHNRMGNKSTTPSTTTTTSSSQQDDTATATGKSTGTGTATGTTRGNGIDDLDLDLFPPRSNTQRNGYSPKTITAKARAIGATPPRSSPTPSSRMGTTSSASAAGGGRGGGGTNSKTTTTTSATRDPAPSQSQSQEAMESQTKKSNPQSQSQAPSRSTNNNTHPQTKTSPQHSTHGNNHNHNHNNLPNNTNNTHSSNHMNHVNPLVQVRLNELEDMGDYEYTKFVRSLLIPDDAHASQFGTSMGGSSGSASGGTVGTATGTGTGTGMGGTGMGGYPDASSGSGTSSLGIGLGSAWTNPNRSGGGSGSGATAGVGSGGGGGTSGSVTPSENDDDEEDYEEEDEHDDDDDEEEEDDDEDEGSQTGEKDASSKSTRSRTKQGSSESESLEPVSVDMDDYDFDELDLDPMALEEELGGLLEEDMEAAVNSLIQQNDMTEINHMVPISMPMPSLNASGTGTGAGAGASVGSAAGSGGATTSASSATTTADGYPPSNHHSAPASTGGGGGGASASSSTATQASSTPVRTIPGHGGSTHAPIHTHTPSKAAASAATSASKFPTPSHRQIIHLQQLMNQHYQILLQQATLAVRAAHGNKFKAKGGQGSGGGGGAGGGGGGGGSVSGAKRKRQEHFFCCGETADDLAGILDGAVTMLQDLDKNRKDAIRYSIQMSRVNYNKRQKVVVDHGHGGGGGGSAGTAGTGGGGTVTFGMTKMHGFYPAQAPSAARAILLDDGDRRHGTSGNGSTGATAKANNNEDDRVQEGILTRSAFTRTLRESDFAAAVNPSHGFGIHSGAPRDMSESSNSKLGSNTTFGVRGLARLDETFAAIDNSLSAQSATDAANGAMHPGTLVRMKPALNRLHDADNIFLEPHHGRACEILLRHARADYDRNIIPGYRELYHHLTYPSEIMGTEEGMPMSEDQQRLLRSNRAQFTAAEDNLLLRGVNLYGEKEWMFISDRFLPDRSVSIIAQRYWRLCLLIYRGHGIYIDQSGNFKEPPQLTNGIDDFDEYAITQALKPVKQPVAFGLYRWSMEEDLLLLKAVPLMGRMFAEIGKRFIPYRDRGALRKRYQVLERRVKGAIKRDKKILRENRVRAAPLKLKPPKPIVHAPDLTYAANAMRQIKPSSAPQPASYGRMPPNTHAPPQTYVGGGDYYSRSTSNANVAYPSQSRREVIPSNMVSNILPPPSSDSFSNTTIGRVIDGEWSQMGRIIAQDNSAGGTKSRFDDRYPAGGHSHHHSAGSQYLQPQNYPPQQQYPPPGQYAPHPQYLPNMSFNEGSLSGLSMLGESSMQGLQNQVKPSGTMRKGESILNSVMKRTNESAASYSKHHPSQYTAQPAKGSYTASQPGTRDDPKGKTKSSSSTDTKIADKIGIQTSPPSKPQINSNLNFSQMGSSIRGFDHSLMEPPELDAISVLNQMQMSNSSIGCFGKSKNANNTGPTVPSSPFKPPRNNNLERKRSPADNSFISGTTPGKKSKSSFLDKVKQKVVASKKK